MHKSAYIWADLTSDEWKIIGILVMPADPNEGCYWAYHLPNGGDEVKAQRAKGQLTTTLKRHEGRLLLLGKRPPKVRDEAERIAHGIQNLPGKASWL